NNTNVLEETQTMSSGSLSSVLGEPFIPDKNFSTFQSFSQQAGVTPSSYTVYEWTLGPYNSSGSGAAGLPTLSTTSLPQGTVIVGFVETAPCTPAGSCGQVTPNSESLTVGTPGTSVPEPSSTLLLSLALLGVVFVSRKMAAARG